MVHIVSRLQWGADPNTYSPWITVPTPDVWLHHTVADVHGPSGMRILQHAAVTEGYSDIEYNFIIDDDGVAYEGRGAGKKSAAQNAPGGPDNNSRSHALCAFGNFETKYPTDQLLMGIANLLAYLYQNRFIALPKITGPHALAPGCATACCGKNLIARIPQINEIAADVKGVYQPKGGAVDIVRTPSGHGYYVVASDGGVFCFGDARFFGSMAGKPLNAAVIGMAVMPANNGYILVSADGGVFCFGAALYKGSMAGKTLAAPIVACEYDLEGDGYWLLAKDGGIFTFGATNFYGTAFGKVKYP